MKNNNHFKDSRKTIKIITLIVLQVLLGSGCLAQPNNNEKVNNHFNHFLEQINTNRINTINNFNYHPINDYTLINENHNELFSDNEIKNIIKSEQTINDVLYEISIDSAKKDITYLFKLFKSVYGAYYYFGGDDKFKKAENAIIQELNDFENSISIDSLTNLILDNITFINDRHLLINDYEVLPWSERLNFYINDKYEIYKKESGYFLQIDNNLHKLNKIDDSNDFYSFLKPSISDTGKLCYVLGLREKNKFEYVLLKLELSNNEENFKLEVKLDPIKPEFKQGEQLFNEYLEDNIPLIRVSGMYNKSEEDISMNSFVNSGNKYKDNELLIIDLRSNTGGSNIWQETWFENYTGLKPNSPKTATCRWSKTYYKKVESWMEYLGDTEPYKTYFDNATKLVKDGYGKWENMNKSGKWVSNDNLIFVIIDQFVGSAAEEFVASLRTLENVVFIGTPTAGIYFIGDPSYYYLPKSNIPVFMGVTFSLDSKGKNIDGNGFEPDLWIGNDDPIEKTKKLIENYKLKIFN